MAEHPRLQAIPGGLDEGAGVVRRAARSAPVREPLWREALGGQLRSLRLERGEKLTETAGRAGISPQYLSEVERGRKEPSSEMIAALAGALGTSLGSLTRQVAEDLLRARPAPARHPAISPLAISPVLLAA
ncbi:helix-turn-helix domain-containing protein [Nocardia sp. NPDC059246]|uniref:helix-turn-helix domain-containing protein n=1 Tax=unclassified Nocardia TaxID=2637762 RepID=UPI0036C69E26